MPVDFEKEYKEAYKQNIANMLMQLDTGKLNTKIDNFCNTHEFNRNDLINAIKDSVYLQVMFAINPNKQNIYEKIAGRHIKSIRGVVAFEKLPNDSLYISNGGVITKKQKKQTGSVSTAKTIDFTWRFAEQRFYASHKYTKESGGSQKSQYKDLLAFIAEANKTTLEKTYFIAIADGDFYQQTNGEVNKLRIDRLKQEANNNKGVHACDINELESLMIEIVV